jgi:hypothetical protein
MIVIRTLVWLLFCLAVSSCGGSGSLAGGEGVGTGGTGISLGTVTGFGSVVVDGKPYSSASPQYFAQSSLTDAAPALPGDVNLGDQVQVDLDAQGNPSSVIIAPDLVGLVTAVDASGFSVNGVRVQFNNILANGPLTYFSGLQGPSDVQNGMQVAVSGAFGMDISGIPWVQATLIERLPDSNTILRTSGIVTNLNRIAQTFQLAGMTVQYNPLTVLPKPASLANGVFVKVWSNQSLSNGGAMMSAGIVRVRTLSGRTGSAQLSGLVSQRNGSHFQIGGIAVDAGASSLAASLGSIANGQYVIVRGQIDSNSTGVIASALDSYASQPVQTEIQGVITGYTGASSIFFVRGVPVDASSAQITYASGVSALADGLYVDLVGSVGNASADVIVAQTLAVISPQALTGKTVNYRGVVRQFVSANQSFVINYMVNGSPVSDTVTLASNVSYRNGDASQLGNNVGIELEATKNASGLTGYSVNFIGTGPSASGGGAPPVLVRGRVDAVTATTLKVAGLLIQLNGVSPQGGVLANGARVEVWVSVSAGQLVAQSITVK